MSVIPIISLWGPWANWIALGWKTIETRRHRRFASLLGKRIGIHVTYRWDDTALEVAAPYLTYEQQLKSRDFLRVGGAIICTAHVSRFIDICCPLDSKKALIDCEHISRSGLVLTDVRHIEAIPCGGKQGIWYHEVPVGQEGQ